uniref:protein-serine/threonine phosphatase n=1 Tax=Zea mays TaxID=4577 RepID=A0A804QRC9_MAIZE
MDVSVGSRARHLTDVDGDLWDLVRRDVQLKATFLYIDLNRLIACNECEERREEITLLANNFFYSKDRSSDRCLLFPSMSSCTALSIFKQGDLMVVANAGDSRVVLGTASDNGAATTSSSSST